MKFEVQNGTIQTTLEGVEQNSFYIGICTALTGEVHKLKQQNTFDPFKVVDNTFFSRNGLVAYRATTNVAVLLWPSAPMTRQK
jgi:hypothetical protein